MQALLEPWTRPGRVGLVVTPLVRNDPALRDIILRVANAWPRRLPAAELWGDTGLAVVCGHQLLAALLTSAPVCDVTLERLLINVRFALLDMTVSGRVPSAVADQVLDFCCALAQQCFLNEYVYACSAEESEQARALMASLGDAIRSGKGCFIAAAGSGMACYGSLDLLPGVTGLADRP